MAKNKISDLRDHLFETIEGLKDGSIDIDKAKAISTVASTIIDSARVEVKFLEVVGVEDQSKFFDSPKTIIGETPKKTDPAKRLT